MSNESIETKNSRFEAPVKKDYLILDQSKKILNLNYVSEKDKAKLQNEFLNFNDNFKKESNDENKKIKRLRGMNTNRHSLMNEKNIYNKDIKLCSKFAGSFGLENYSESIENCPFIETCKFSHDIISFMKNNPVYLDKPCYMFNEYGFCGYGHRCKFGKSHLNMDNFHNILDEDKFFKNGPNYVSSYNNFLNNELRLNLRKKKIDFLIDEIIGPASYDEKQWKKIDFNNKLYLAPLTTVGNLPFRRICKEFGADITCGEMALAQNIVEGSISEWALLRRHKSEDLFGVQICGSNQEILTKATKLINDYCNVDFIDLNMGCPIDLIYKKGGGAGLMSRFNKVNKIITTMSRVSNVPITLKMRTGVYENKYLADKLIKSISNQFNDGRIGLITVHGRSRESRYTKNTNWDYIKKCASNTETIPIFGSGDILSYKDYDNIMNCKNNTISGIMIGRGALIKPWIFTEIKEKRDWDISSKERFDILKKFVNYGLEHWGCDNEGVEKTRKFFLEWLSFLCRYIPVGLLEVVPQKINERPPLYRGRDDLETLFASPCCNDWIKISEIFLGPVKNDFTFLPKHKANAYT